MKTFYLSREKDRRSVQKFILIKIHNQDQDILKRIIESLIEAMKSIGLLSQTQLLCDIKCNTI